MAPDNRWNQIHHAHVQLTLVCNNLDLAEVRVVDLTYRQTVWIT